MAENKRFNKSSNLTSKNCNLAAAVLSLKEGPYEV